MPRHSSLPAIVLAVCSLVPSIIAAQNGKQNSPIDVLYVVTNNTIQTYDVDPSYGSAGLDGALKVPGINPALVPGINDEFVYVLSQNKGGGSDLLVYATDSQGAPQNPPVQKIEFPNALRDFVIDPAGRLAYAAEALPNSSQPSAAIQAFAINPQTGNLSGLPYVADEYPPSSGLCNSENPFADPTFYIVGFTSAGHLIDEWWCDGYDDWAGYYFTRAVDHKTGALGPDVPTVGTGSSEDEFSTVAFTPGSILSFVNYGYQNSANDLYVYWPNATLDFTCTYSMLDACSYSGSVAADRTGLYLFFNTYAGATQVAALNMQQQTISPVGIPFADGVNTFSLDDQLIYGERILWGDHKYVTPVYVFDPSTGLITDNEQNIPMPSRYSVVIPALRR